MQDFWQEFQNFLHWARNILQLIRKITAFQKFRVHCIPTKLFDYQCSIVGK